MVFINLLSNGGRQRHHHSSSTSTTCTLLVLLFTIYLCEHNTKFCCFAYSPDVNHRALAGLWKLTQSKPISSSASTSTSTTTTNKNGRYTNQFPMKEFTVYPKKEEKETRTYQQQATTLQKQQEEEEVSQEILLMLKEDGSFQEYSVSTGEDDDNDDDDDDDSSNKETMTTTKSQIPDKLSFHDADEAVLEHFFGKIKGQWDFVDGKLLLAAERPKNYPKPQDTLLVGTVVATSETSLDDNPALQQQQQQEEDNTTTNDKQSLSSSLTSKKTTTNPTTSSSSSSTKGTVSAGSSVPSSTTVSSSSSSKENNNNNKNLDTHLSVPKGKVKVGKFFYPRGHPSFFDQPIYNPKSKGVFQLKQVLGSLNTKQIEDDELIEKFHVKDFYNKRFLLTAHPIGERRPKGNLRWSIKYNRFVEDPPKKKSKKEQQEEENRPIPIRVMEVKFFTNNTFASVAGLGESILRGKFDIIGKERDHLWMQIWRFGFGRSVSGSVYSEGRSLTKEDEKAYWGQISFETDDDEANQDPDDATIDSNAKKDETQSNNNNNDNDGDNNTNNQKRIQVKGSVLLGYGLEPIPVAKFIMREATEEEEDYLDEDEDDDDDDDEATINNLNNLIFGTTTNNPEDDEDGNNTMDDTTTGDNNNNDDGIDWTNSFQ